MRSLEDAIVFATAAHDGQKDKGGQPYILHPLAVMLTMDTDEERIVAVLHDVVEDTPMTLEHIDGWGSAVRDAVDCLTRREGESYDTFIERVATNPVARRVKIVDLQHNMQISRLVKVTKKDVARLDKYAKARAYLLGVE